METSLKVEALGVAICRRNIKRISFIFCHFLSKQWSKWYHISFMFQYCSPLSNFKMDFLHYFLKLQFYFSEALKDYRRRYIIHVLVIVIDLHSTGFIIKKYIKLKQLIMTHWKKSATKKILWRIAMVKTSLIQSISNL